MRQSVAARTPRNLRRRSCGAGLSAQAPKCSGAPSPGRVRPDREAPRMPEPPPRTRVASPVEESASPSRRLPASLSVQEPKTMNRTEWGLLVLLSVLWGGAFFCVGVAVVELPPLTVVLARVGPPGAGFRAVRRAYATPPRCRGTARPRRVAPPPCARARARPEAGPDRSRAQACSRDKPRQANPPALRTPPPPQTSAARRRGRARSHPSRSARRRGRSPRAPARALRRAIPAQSPCVRGRVRRAAGGRRRGRGLRGRR